MEMSWIELVGALLSAWAVWLTAQRKPWSWPVGLLSVVVYVGISAEAKLYSDALLQVAFAILIVYGWHRWLQNLDADGRVQVAALPMRQAIGHVALGVFGSLLLGFAMHRWTDAALPWLDSALTAFSLVAQWWQARRHIAAWWAMDRCRRDLRRRVRLQAPFDYVDSVCGFYRAGVYRRAPLAAGRRGANCRLSVARFNCAQLFCAVGGILATT